MRRPVRAHAPTVGSGASHRPSVVGLASSWTLLLIAVGCSTPSRDFEGRADYYARTLAPLEVAAEIIFCNDAVGHDPNNLPFLFGGRCVCTPSISVVDAYRKLGLAKEWTATALEVAYAHRGVKLEPDHVNCNNLCEWGPHVVKGGRCMVTPVAGTRNFEEVVTGEFRLSLWERSQVADKGGALAPEPFPRDTASERATETPATETPATGTRAPLQEDENTSRHSGASTAAGEAALEDAPQRKDETDG